MFCLAAVAAGCGLVIKDPVALLRFEHHASKTPTFSRAEAIAELDTLARLIDRVHADPYRFQSREVVDAERRRLIETMPASLTQRDLCLHLTRLVAVLDDGHSDIDCDSLIRQEWRKAATASPPEKQTLRMFPPDVRLDDQNHVVVQWWNYTPGVFGGDRLLRINGQDVDALVAAWARETAHDTEAGRLAVVARRFRLELELHGIRAPYRVTVAAPDGRTREATVEGEPVNYMFQPRPVPEAEKVRAANQGAPDKARPTTARPTELRTPFFYYHLIGADVGYMNLFSFIGDSMMSTDSGFTKAVDALFRQVAADKPRVLIIDVRENGGGDDEIGAELLRHLTEKPFRLLASWQVKRSSEVRDAGKSIIRIPFRWMGLPLLIADGRRYYLGAEGSLSEPATRSIRTWPRGEPFFDGPVCVLTGPHTYSAASEFADAVKTFGLATIVGEPTGGQPNSFGNPFVFHLKRSGLAVQIATVRSVRASGDVSDNRPVMPDIAVHPTAADLAKNVDPVVVRAISCPARSIR